MVIIIGFLYVLLAVYQRQRLCYNPSQFVIAVGSYLIPGILFRDKPSPVVILEFFLNWITELAVCISDVALFF